MKAFTAAMYMSGLLRIHTPTEPEEFYRYATVSIAAEQAQELVGWNDAEASAALLTAIKHESNLRKDVHEGTLRGKAGEICLVQIHPVNTAWSRFSPTFEGLAGTDLESTTRCLAAGLWTLKYSLSYCYAKKYKKNRLLAMWTMYHYGSRCWISPHAKPRTRTMLSFLQPVPEDYEHFDVLTLGLRINEEE